MSSGPVTMRTGGYSPIGISAAPPQTAGFYPTSQVSYPYETVVEPARIISQPAVEVIQDNSQFSTLTSQFESERRMRMDLQAQLNAVSAELAACKARLDKLDPPESPLRAAVRRVEQRGHVRVNLETGHVQLIHPITFHPRTTKDEPTAVLRDPELSESICRDLAEISQIFNCPMTIEGHTKGGQNDFWQTLANRRAMLIADKMVEYGANPNLLETRGLPGRLGKNEVRTEVYMDIRNIKEELAAVQVVQGEYIQDVVAADGYGGAVVERAAVYRPASPATIVRPAVMM